MGLTVLSVSFPFAPISADPVGGAEQVLARLDLGLVEAGHRSIVIAAEGSSVAGELHELPAWRGPVDASARAFVHSHVRRKIRELIQTEKPDIVHLHGLDFGAYLPPSGPPVVVTLHLPLAWYDRAALEPSRANTSLHPVSVRQAREAPAGLRLAPVIENGVETQPASSRKGRYVLCLGRICPEKGFEDAILAAALAKMPLLLAGQVFPYAEHQAYFVQQIAPRLGRGTRFLGPVHGEAKRRLLARALCLLVPSRVSETACLVGMEALAAGTPVVAYPVGALQDLVEPGRTGFLVSNPADMAEAIKACGHLSPADCQASARMRFPAERMVAAYLSRYRALAAA